MLVIQYWEAMTGVGALRGRKGVVAMGNPWHLLASQLRQIWLTELSEVLSQKNKSTIEKDIELWCSHGGPLVPLKLGFNRFKNADAHITWLSELKPRLIKQSQIYWFLNEDQIITKRHLLNILTYMTIIGFSQLRYNNFSVSLCAHCSRI